MYYFVNINFFIFKFCDRHQVIRVQTHTVCTMRIDKNRHNWTINSEFKGRTKGLQTLS